jgi:hypothetical protein
MAGAARKWAIGCGIGCGLMIIIAGGLGTCAYVGVKKIADGAEGMEEGFETLDATYGEIGEFVPEADGTIRAGRMEVFLDVRDDLVTARGELGAMLETLDEGGPGNFFDKIKAGMGFIPGIFRFINERNEVLIERGMGLGEYTHIYTVAYYSWLEKPVSDGPSFTINDDDQGDGDIRWSMETTGDRDVFERREEDVRRYLHDIQVELLANQIAAAESAGLDEVWLGELRAEAERLDGLSRGLLWERGLPAQLRDSLEPYRVRLEESYEPLMNAVEMGTMTHH